MVVCGGACLGGDFEVLVPEAVEGAILEGGADAENSFGSLASPVPHSRLFAATANQRFACAFHSAASHREAGFDVLGIVDPPPVVFQILN